VSDIDIIASIESTHEEHIIVGIVRELTGWKIFGFFFFLVRQQDWPQGMRTYQRGTEKSFATSGY
jgi:hypothetical protein